MSQFSEMVDYGEKLVWGEEIGIDEMYITRSERQKNVLLEKASVSTPASDNRINLILPQKLVEESDEQWELLLVDHISRCVDTLIT